MMVSGTVTSGLKVNPKKQNDSVEVKTTSKPFSM